MGKLTFLNKDLRPSNANSSGAMRKLSDAGLSGLSSSQKQKFYSVLKENKGSVSKTLGVLDKLKNDGINSNKVFKIKRALGETVDYSGYRKNNASKPAVDMRNVYNEIMDKRRATIQTQTETPAREKSKVVDFSVSRKNLRKAENLYVRPEERNGPVSIYEKLDKVENSESAQERLDRILGKNGNIEEEQKDKAA